MRYAVINNGVVSNVIEIEPEVIAEGWMPPGGGELLASDAAEIGFLYADGVFAPPPAPVPQFVSNFQGRAMLRAAGLFDAVASAIAGIADDGERAIAQEAFERADFARRSPLFISVARQLGKTDDEIDDMMRQAAAIKV